MSTRPEPSCPDCVIVPSRLTETALPRRTFLRGVAATAVSGMPVRLLQGAATTRPAGPTPGSTAETGVKALYDLLSDEQRKLICFPWEHEKPGRGLLRTHVSNNWHVSSPKVRSDFFSKRQQSIIYDVFQSLFQPEWAKKITRQLKDDTYGEPWGADQSIALFGKPGEGKFEFVMTGRHLTIRADGNSESRVAFGGPIFHGHAADGFNEKPGHPGNIFWPQALAANRVYAMLDGRQRDAALVDGPLPPEAAVAFREVARAPGIPVADLTADQKVELEKVLAALLEPYRDEDRAEAMECLKKQGGLDACRLAFYKDSDLGNDQEWDNWRLEGPALVWYFRGYPHVHIWINVADDPSVALNARG
ncbi:MAG: hypothetical protein AMXMBFR13_37430 [Phycisphaerae bacterium]|jgi:hypothetical protein